MSHFSLAQNRLIRNLPFSVMTATPARNTVDYTKTRASISIPLATNVANVPQGSQTDQLTEIAKSLNKVKGTSIDVLVPGGKLGILWEELSAPVYLEGEVDHTFDGTYNI